MRLGVLFAFALLSAKRHMQARRQQLRCCRGWRQAGWRTVAEEPQQVAERVHGCLAAAAAAAAMRLCYTALAELCERRRVQRARVRAQRARAKAAAAASLGGGALLAARVTTELAVVSNSGCYQSAMSPTCASPHATKLVVLCRDDAARTQKNADALRHKKIARVRGTMIWSSHCLWVYWILVYVVVSQLG